VVLGEVVGLAAGLVEGCGMAVAPVEEPPHPDRHNTAVRGRPTMQETMGVFTGVPLSRGSEAWGRSAMTWTIAAVDF